MVINKINTVWINYCCIFNKELQITSACTCSPVSLTGYSYTSTCTLEFHQDYTLWENSTLGFHQDYSLWEKYIIHFSICHMYRDHDGPRWPYRVSDLQHKLSYSLTISSRMWSRRIRYLKFPPSRPHNWLAAKMNFRMKRKWQIVLSVVLFGPMIIEQKMEMWKYNGRSEDEDDGHEVTTIKNFKLLSSFRGLCTSENTFIIFAVKIFKYS